MLTDALSTEKNLKGESKSRVREKSKPLTGLKKPSAFGQIFLIWTDSFWSTVVIGMLLSFWYCASTRSLHLSVSCTRDLTYQKATSVHHILNLSNRFICTGLHCGDCQAFSVWAPAKGWSRGAHCWSCASSFWSHRRFLFLECQRQARKSFFKKVKLYC